MTRIEPKPPRGLVTSAIVKTGQTLHWLGKRVGHAGGGHAAMRLIDIWREGGRSLLRDHMLSEAAAARRDARYRLWMRDVEPALMAGVTGDARSGERGPRFSIIVPVHDTPPAMLRECIDSVLAQTWPCWSLLLIDDASTRRGTQDVLNSYEGRDDRIVVVRRSQQGGISAATNDGLRAAEGEYIALLDHDDTLSAQALAAMAQRLTAGPAADVLYSDEDKIDERGRRHTPVFKPGFSPHHLFTSNYCCHLLVVRAQLMRDLGGLRSAFDGAQDYDLVLRCLEHGARFAHVPLVLYHWRTHLGSTSGAGRAKPYAAEAGRQALEESMRRSAVTGVVEHSPFLLSYRVRPKVSAEDQVDVVRTERDGRVDPREWCASSDDPHSRWVLFLAKDAVGLTPAQVHVLIEAAKMPLAGAVGGVAVSSDGRIVDAGWLIDRDGQARGRYRASSALAPGAGWSLRLPRNVSFVGPQCLLVERCWAQRAMSEQREGEPWWMALARLMRSEGRMAQVVGSVQVRLRTARLGGDPIFSQGACDGLLNEHLAWIEPEYALGVEAGRLAANAGKEGACAASPV